MTDVVHHCWPDRYRGRYRVRDQDSWSLVWFIEGPGKAQVIRTRYLRLD
jgi:Family of unknown function (DUF6314)